MNIFDDVDEHLRPIKKTAERAARGADWLPRDRTPTNTEAMVYVVLLVALACYGVGAWLF